MNWIIVAATASMFLVPFLFKLTKYENVEIVDKITNREGIHISYLLVVISKNNKLTLPTNREVYNQLTEGNIVTLYYNTGSEKVTSFNI